MLKLFFLLLSLRGKKSFDYLKMKFNLLLLLLILTLKQEYQLVLAQGASCSNDNQCPTGGGGGGGTCTSGFCSCFIGVSGASCNTGSYSKEYILNNCSLVYNYLISKSGFKL